MKKFIGIVLALCLCLSFVPCGAGESAQADGSDKDFEKIINMVCAKWSIPPENVIAGYLNLVTGEEHYWQGDRWEYCASMYKVPLNMLAAEKMVTGELDWEKKYPAVPYESVLEETLLYSSNEWAEFLWRACGGCYANYKQGVMPYMGIKTSDLYEMYPADNKFTARQIIHCLRTLYDNPDRFPSILDTMMKADPERFFRFAEKRYPIAQKYGYVTEGYSYYENSCAIVFTDEPIAIVMYTKNAPHPEETLSAYCTAMCDYTQNKIKH